MFLKTDGEVITFRERLLGWRVLPRYWEHGRERCSTAHGQEGLWLAGGYAEGRVLKLVSSIIISLKFLN